MNEIVPPTTTTAPKVAWYFNVSLVQVLLIFLFPIGFTLMWLGRVFSARTRWIVTGFLGLFIVSLMSSKAPQRGADLAVSPNVVTSVSPEPLRIIATVDQFKDAIPLLGRLPMDTVTRDGATEYVWRDVSTIGNPNAVRIYDLGGDGRLDWLLATVVIQNERKDSNMESFMLALRLISVAGGSTSEEAASVISAWIPKAVAKGGDTRRFGTVDVDASFIKASDGGILMIHIIGTEEGRAVVLGKPAVGSKVAPSADAARVITISALKVEQGIVSHDRLPDPRTLSAEAKAAEDARITAAIAAVRSKADAQERQATDRAAAAWAAFRAEVTPLTDRLRKQALSEPRPVDAHQAALRVQDFLLRNTELVLTGSDTISELLLVRDDSQATIAAINASIAKRSADYRAANTEAAAVVERSRSAIADLEVQRPAVRASKVEADALVRIAALNAVATEIQTQASSAGHDRTAVTTKVDLLKHLEDLGRICEEDRVIAGKMRAERVGPFLAQCKAETKASRGMPKAEEACQALVARVEALSTELRQREEQDVSSLIAHHRALVGGLPTNGTASGIAAVCAAVAADQRANPDRWSNPWMSAPWQEMLGAMVREVAQDPGIATMTVADVVENVMRPWQIDPAGAQQGRYAPLLAALIQAPSIKSASEGDGVTALEVLAKLPETQRQQLGKLRIALEDAIGDNQRATAGTGGLGTINAWTETRALSLPPDSRTHHIVLINRLNAGKTGDDVVKVASIIKQDIESNRIHWNYPGATPEMVNQIIDVYGKLQAAQYLGFKAKMVTPMAVMLEAAHHFDEGMKWGWGTYQEPVSGNGAKFTAAVRGIDKEEARVIDLLGSGAALIPEAGPPTPALWHRIAVELGVAKP